MHLDKHSIQRIIVNHVEYTLACNRCNMNTHKAMLATSYSLRDRLIEDMNDTETYMLETKAKCVNYLSIEYLLGRLLHQVLTNIGLEGDYYVALKEMGYLLEDLYEDDRDAALGNGGLGRLAACFMDSLATMNVYGSSFSSVLCSFWVWHSVQLRHVRAANRRWVAGRISGLLALVWQSLGNRTD